MAVALRAVMVIGALAFSPPRRPELPPPIAEEAIEVGPSEAREPEPPPTAAFSPAPVSLSTRASMPTRPPKPTPRPEPVALHWLDYDGQRQQYAVLQSGQSYRQQTYVGHP
ncbi:VHL beta domain-containing protein [Micromonospora sp. IBHARD004]|uniref:VHL beta domain-containing protein n=1 Tax=Micromonospora sp. IBHARD004 TaxID=3457764 RepID=UPI00405871A0